MLKQRVITALIIVFVLGNAVYFLPYQGFVLLALGIFSVGAWEWANLAGIRQLPSRMAYVLLVTSMMAWAVHFSGLWQVEALDVQRLQLLLLVACLWWLVALAFVVAYPKSAGLWSGRLLRSIMGLLVLSPSCLALVYVRGLDYGLLWFVYLIAVVCAADTGAYFAGRAWGNKKLAPNVSPKKSWAGFWGGVASTSTLALIVGAMTNLGQISYFGFVLLTIFTGVASVLGDLFESMIKRNRGIKDSSHILPGHGGVLDRMDSITAAAPFFALSVIYLG